MKEKNTQFFSLQSGETPLVFVLGFAIMANALAMQIAGIVSVSGFLNSGGVNSILIVLFVDYAFVLITGALQSLVIDKFTRKDLILWTSLVFALLFVILRLMFLFEAPDWLNYSLMYLLAEQQFILFPLIFWVLANDIFDFSQAKRLFPVISGWNFAGKLIGIGIAAVSPLLFAKLEIKLEEILTINTFLYLLTFIVLWRGLRNIEVRKTVTQTETLKNNLREGWDFITNVPSFRFMMYTIVALAVADTLIEFRFLVVTDSVFQDQNSYQTFFSMYRLGITMLSMILQAFVTGVLIKNMELKNTFIFFPVIAFVGAFAMILLPGVNIAVAVMASVKLIRDTVNDSSRKSFQGLVPEERRGRVSTLMETYLPSIGTMLACVAGYAIVYIGNALGVDVLFWYMLVAALGGVFALGTVLKMHSVYDASMYNWRLKRRQRKAYASLLDKLTK